MWDFSSLTFFGAIHVTGKCLYYDHTVMFCYAVISLKMLYNLPKHISTSLILNIVAMSIFSRYSYTAILYFNYCSMIYCGGYFKTGTHLVS